MLDKQKFLTALERTEKHFTETSKQYGEISLKDIGKSEFLKILINDINKGAFDSEEAIRPEPEQVTVS